MHELIIPFLTFLSVTALGGAILTAWAARRQPVQARLHQLEEQAIGESSSPPKVFGLLGRIGSVAMGGGPSTTLRQELSRAGFHSEAAPGMYLGVKLLFLMIALTVLAAVVLPMDSTSLVSRTVMIVFGSGMMFFIPNLYLAHRQRGREREVRSQLADVVDLLEISVSSGMGLDAAWNSVGDQIREVSEVMGDEMALTNLEMHLGAPRAEAMRHMSQRTGVEELGSLVGVLVQSDRFGTSVADALRTFANSMREIRSQKAEEVAEKMPVKLLFPLILLIFPAMLVVIVGPASLEWAKIIGGG